MVYGASYVMYGLMQFFGRVPYNATQYLIELNLSIGVTALIIGLGLLLAKEWARIACLSALTFLLSIHIFFLALTYLVGDDPTLQVANVILTALLFLTAWSKLTRPTVKQLFS